VPVHLGDRNIKSSPKHVLLGFVIGVSLVAVLYYLEPMSAAYERCQEVAQTKYERCSKDSAIQNDGALNPPQNACSLKREQDLLACY
jgi:hypothetical protein